MPKIRTAFLFVGVLVLAACAEGGAAPPPAGGSTTYVCSDGQKIVATYPDPRTAVVTLQGHTHAMTTAPSADGVRYVGDGWQWWTKGMTQGTLAQLKPGEQIAGAPGVACMAQP
jgi:membrane-bound inhibitor of C-type lysozyme